MLTKWHNVIVAWLLNRGQKEKMYSVIMQNKKNIR